MISAAASAARPILWSVTSAPTIRVTQCGIGWCPTTLSSTIFSGHGPARLIAVSTSIARRMTVSLPR